MFVFKIIVYIMRVSIVLVLIFIHVFVAYRGQTVRIDVPKITILG